MTDYARVFSYLKQSILSFERNRLSSSKMDFETLDILEKLLGDEKTVVPKDYVEHRDQYIHSIQNTLSGTAL